MTTDAPARRLLAGLVDEQALETEAIADIRADLAALGLDPARAVALARRLAAGTQSPALALLSKIAEVEGDDDEIRSLERVDLAAVRRRLDAGSAASAVAHAQRAAGRDSNVMPLPRRRSRRLLYGLSSVAAALAASVVLIVGLSTQQEMHLQAPVEPTRTVALQPPTSQVDNLQARLAPAAEGPAQVAEQAAAAPATPQQSADAEMAARAKSEADESKASRLASRPESQLVDSPTQAVGALTAGEEGQSSTEELRGDALANQIAAPFGLNRPVAALLIVDPKLVPAGLKQENYPTGDLLARLDDARRLAADHPIAALVTLRLVDRTIDGVLIPISGSRTVEGSRLFRREIEAGDQFSSAGAPAGRVYDIMLLDRR